MSRAPDIQPSSVARTAKEKGLGTRQALELLVETRRIELLTFALRTRFSSHILSDVGNRWKEVYGRLCLVEIGANGGVNADSAFVDRPRAQPNSFTPPRMTRPSH